MKTIKKINKDERKLYYMLSILSIIEALSVVLTLGRYCFDKSTEFLFNSNNEDMTWKQFILFIIK